MFSTLDTQISEYKQSMKKRELERYLSSTRCWFNIPAHDLDAKYEKNIYLHFESFTLMIDKLIECCCDEYCRAKPVEFGRGIYYPLEISMTTYENVSHCLNIFIQKLDDIVTKLHTNYSTDPMYSKALWYCKEKLKWLIEDCITDGLTNERGLSFKVEYKNTTAANKMIVSTARFNAMDFFKISKLQEVCDKIVELQTQQSSSVAACVSAVSSSSPSSGSVASAAAATPIASSITQTSSALFRLPAHKSNARSVQQFLDSPNKKGDSKANLDFSSTKSSSL